MEIASMYLVNIRCIICDGTFNEKRIRIPMVKIRQSHDRLIFNMGFPIAGKDGLYIEVGPRAFNIDWFSCNHPGPVAINQQQLRVRMLIQLIGPVKRGGDFKSTILKPLYKLASRPFPVNLLR